MIWSIMESICYFSQGSTRANQRYEWERGTQYAFRMDMKYFIRKE